MKLKELLKHHEGGVAETCVSIYEGANDKTHYFFVKEDQEKILACKRYREIADRDVRRYCIIGGGIYPVELCIGLE